MEHKMPQISPNTLPHPTSDLFPVTRPRLTSTLHVKGLRHFQFSATRDYVIIECATLLAIMGKYAACAGRGGSKESGRAAEAKGRRREAGPHGEQLRGN
ncbi:hypothetical protein KM043_016250 [Ampulex compressa]|nr:hypothetical protein KM043_016250 [Ampulex compressa]